MNQNNFKELDEKGYTIVNNVLTQSEINECKNDMWNFAEGLTEFFNKPLNRLNHETYETWHKTFPMRGMMQMYHGVSNLQLSWNIRQNPNVVKVFSDIWKVPMEDLLVSFEGIGFGLPPEYCKGKGYYRNIDWFHVDQTKLHNYTTYQSFVTLEDIYEGDATFHCISKSHKYYDYIMRDLEKVNKTNQYKIPKEDLNFLLEFAGLKKELIKAKAGSLIIWNSKLIHCGIQPRINRPVPNIRSIVYLSYSPRIKSNNKDIQLKLKAFQNGKTTSHWAHTAITNAGNKPRLYTKEDNDNFNKIIPYSKKPILTNLGKRLAGFPNPFVTNCKNEKYDVYIGKPKKGFGGSSFANHINISNPEKAHHEYIKWIMDDKQKEFRNEVKKRLKGKILGSWESPKLCHGDILAKIANE